MRILLIMNQDIFARSFQRYLHYLFQFSTDIITFSPLKESGISHFTDYDMFISDVYDRDDINYGVQFGSLFEKRNKSVFYFFTEYSFISGYTIKDLPVNCLYLPLQLSALNKMLSGKNTCINSSSILMKVLYSNPLTSSHH